jgi:hypothetical protein
VYRHARTGLVRAEQLANGVILVWSGDLEKISKHEAPPNRHRIAVQLAPRAARHAAWMRAAKAQRMTVTALAYQLLDQAAGYSS